jgi:3',5'-cyclic AMP phosphodiesterase CpdA
MVDGNMPILQDESGAVAVWGGECIGLPEFQVGQAWQLRGQITTDGYDLMQLRVRDADDLSTADISAIENPRIVSITEVGDACYELLKIKGVTVTQILQDGDGNQLLIYTGEQEPVFDCTVSLQAGDMLDISGIAWLYNGEAEICTRFSSDLVQSASPVKIAVISDPHYYAPELGTSGTAFEQYLASDRKLIAESKAIVESTVNSIKNSDAEIVLVSGDLTKDGEYLCHQQFASYLQQLEDAGKKVYVIDGNHDINNPHAYSYSGAVATPIKHTTTEEFKTIYNNFGYGEAVATDPGSLSYTVDPVPGLRIVVMDSALYENNIANNAPETAGAFSTDRLNWIKAQIAEGVNQGKIVIGMMHHGVTNHFSMQSQFFPEYVINNASQVASELSSQGMKVVFTGHFHAQDVTKYESANGDFIFDVETGSLVTYPVPYRLMELNPDGSLTIETRKVFGIDYNIGGKSFQNYACDYLKQGLSELIPGMLTGIIMQMQPGLSQADALTAANNAASQSLTSTLTVKDCLVNALVAHYSGDEQINSQLLTLYQGMTQSSNTLTSTLGAALLSLCTDLNPSDNNAFINLINGDFQPLQIGNPVYKLVPVANNAYEIGDALDGIKTMTIKSGFSGFKYFEDLITPVTPNDGEEAVVFVHLRKGVQIGINATKADFDVVQTAKAGFNILPGDVIKSYVVDDLTNEVNRNPVIFQ